MAARSAPLPQKKQPKRLLILGYGASESAELIALHQPEEIVNKIDLKQTTRNDLWQIGADMIICSHDAFEKVLEMPRSSGLLDKLTARQREVLLLGSEGIIEPPDRRCRWTPSARCERGSGGALPFFRGC